MNVKITHGRVNTKGRGIKKHGKVMHKETNLHKLKDSLKTLSLTGKKPRYIAL